MLVKHVLFPDDICVFGPSISSLQCFPCVCCDYADEHEIVSIYKTTIVFRLQNYKQPVAPDVPLNRQSVC